MSKPILWISIVDLILIFLISYLSFETHPELVAGVWAVGFILVIALVFLVYKDTRNSGRSGVYTLLPLFLGGIGGLLYYAIAQSDKGTGQPSQGLSPQAKRATAVFNTLLAVVFGIVVLMSFPYAEPSTAFNPLTVLFSLLFFVSSVIAYVMWKS